MPELPPGLRLLDREELAWSLHLEDELLGHSWLALDGNDDDGALHFTLTALTRSALLGDDARTLVRASLTTAADLTPLAFAMRAGDRGVELSMTGDRVEATLTDGTHTTVEAQGLDGLLDHTLPGLHALLLARLTGSTRPLTALLVQQLLPMSYAVTFDNGGRTAETSLGEQLELDADGVLQRVEVPAQRFRALLARPAPRRPIEVDVPPAAITYQPPAEATFRLEEVPLAGPSGALQATVTVPAGQPPFPAVLFVPGSGGGDRHGIAGRVDTGAHEIVDGLAEAGVLGLRYDKRGTGQTPLGEDLLDMGFETRIDEARAALRALAARPDVDPQRLVVVGHSEGGIVALVLAAEGEPVPAALVLLATPGRRIDEVVVDQIRWHGSEIGLTDEAVQRQVEQFLTFVEHVRRPGPWREDDVPPEVYAGLRQRRWYAELLARVPGELVARARCPVLVCQGTADRQVSPERDAAVLVERATGAGVPVTSLTFEGADHLFKPATGAPRLRDYTESRAVVPQLLADISTWLRQVMPASERAPARD